ncbi:hypothetical protein A2U01_0056795, partial [Trifolium medium]|nr:hypothetical protein [Trifolium medium]
ECLLSLRPSKPVPLPLLHAGMSSRLQDPAKANLIFMKFSGDSIRVYKFELQEQFALKEAFYHRSTARLHILNQACKRNTKPSWDNNYKLLRY